MTTATIGKHDSATADLLDAARAGDAGAIAALLAACQPDIRRYARRSCRSDDVDDAVQDAMLILHRRIGTLRVAAAFPAWLFEIVRRECLRLMRATARLVTLAPPEIASATDSALSNRPEADIRMDVAAAIQSLPDHYRQVILMRDLEEMTIDEIAQALQLTRESTKARLHRARAMVREYLKD
jgi:RNA polymerase sigma-70 factor (ECF subfamily)